MTFKILQGLVDLRRTGDSKASSSAAAARPDTARQAVVTVHTEAVRTSIAVFRNSSSSSAERIGSYDRATTTAKSIAARLTAEGEDDSHANLRTSSQLVRA